MTAAALRRILDSLPVSDAPDAELLRRFARQRDEPAFAELLRRHGPLVLGVCRRVLGEVHAADDVFQATFVQLARRAGHIRCDHSLGGWLHTVARRTALAARRADKRCRRREEAAARAESRAPADMTWAELREVLDAELARLPDSLRLPLILCYLEDRPQAEAAERLGWPLPMLRGRLERGRQRLRRRLVRHGLPLAAPLILLGGDTVAAELRDATLHSVRQALVGETLAPAVAALAAAGPPTLARWQLAAALILLAATLAAGLATMGGATARLRPADPPEKPANAAKSDALGDSLPEGAVLRLGTRRHRVQTYPRDYLSLPDGKSFLIHHGPQVRWMDAESGKITDSWTVPKGQLVAGFSPDGRFALATTQFVFRTGLRRGADVEKQEWLLILYDLKSRKPVWEKSEPLQQSEWKRIDLTIFSPDGKWVLTTARHVPGETRLWDMANGKELWKQPKDAQPLEPLGFADECNTVVLKGISDGRIYLHDRATGQPTRNFEVVPRDAQRQLGLSPDGAYLFVGGAGKAVRVWDVKTAGELPPLGGHADWGATAFAVSGDGKTVVTGGGDWVRVWDWPSGRFRRAFDLGIGSPDRLTLSHDGKRLEALSWFGSEIHRYDVATGKKYELPADGHGGAVEGIASAPDGTLVSVGRDKVVRSWDLTRGRTAARVPLKDFAEQRPFALTPDGKLLVVSRFQEGSVQLIERATGKVVGSLDSKERQLDHIALSPNGQFVAAVTAQQSRVIVWSTTTGQVVHRGDLGGHQNTTAVAFSPDGDLLAASAPGVVRFWDVVTWKERPALTAHAQSGIAFSPDGRMIATASVEGVRVWELTTRKERAWLRPSSYPSCGLTFSPSARFLAWVADNSKIHVWDAWSGELLGPFAGHEERITGLAFAGDRLASSSDDSTILVWDVASRAVKPRPPEDDAAAAWADLAGQDAKAAQAAIRTLAARPDDALRLAREYLKPVAAGDPKRIAAFLRELDNAKFADRQKAAAGLIREGESAIPALQAFLMGEASSEARRQAEQVLIQLEGFPNTTDGRRALRLLEALQRVGGPEVRQFLAELAHGAPEASLTRAARLTLKCMSDR